MDMDKRLDLQTLWPVERAKRRMRQRFHLVSRSRRLYPFAARDFTSVGTKGTLVVLRHKRRRVGKIAWHDLTAWATARRDFAHAVDPGGAPLPTLRKTIVRPTRGQRPRVLIVACCSSGITGENNSAVPRQANRWVITLSTFLSSWRRRTERN